MPQLRTRDRVTDVKPDYVSKLKKIVKARQVMKTKDDYTKREPTVSSIGSSARSNSPRVISKVSMFE